MINHHYCFYFRMVQNETQDKRRRQIEETAGTAIKRVEPGGGCPHQIPSADSRCPFLDVYHAILTPKGRQILIYPNSNSVGRLRSIDL